jgi:ABC-type multidrug transport system ATPase subunit
VGEIFGILGDNGAGKSTLIRQMVNLERSTAGTITLYGQDITRQPLLVPARVGYMPQDVRSLNNLTVGEAFYFTAHLKGLTRPDARAECDALLTRLGIQELRHKSATRLSGGQKRLVQLGIAMAASPPVMILDEPTNELDPQRRHLVWTLIRQLNREHGTTVIFITHDAIEAEKVVHRVAIMVAGQIVSLGRPSELKRVIDRQLRLEMFFPPERTPVLPPGYAPQTLDPGRWLLYLEWEAAGAFLSTMDLTQLDDFRLYSATLEDLYIHYAITHHAPPQPERA